MKTTARAALVLALALTGTSGFVPNVAQAQPGRAKAKPLPTEDAKLRSGIALFDAREFDKAAAELDRLHEATGEVRALYWMGKALQEGGHLSAALRAFKRYGKELPKNDARNIELLGLVQTLTMQVATITVNATEGATIAVDGAEIGTAPLGEAVYLDPGSHTITATRGKDVSSKTVRADEEGRETVDLAFAPPPVETPAPAPRAAVTPAPSRGGSSTALTVGGLGVATALAAGSVYFALSASSSASDLEAKKRELGVSRSDLDSLQSATRLRAGLSVGLGVAALGAAGVTLFVLKKPKTEMTASAPPPRVLVTASGITLAGSFK